MIEKWNYFVFDLCEAKKRDVDEDSYHALIETQLQLLGWAKFKGEICHKANVPIGNSKFIQPDILIKNDGDDQFVIEVKRPVHSQTDRERVQLESYMRQLKLDVGIYIGEHIEIFYDKPKCKDAVSVLRIPLEIDNKLGAKFVEIFSKEQFSKDDIVGFCEKRIQEIQRQNSLNQIKESLIADAQIQISESLKPYLIDKYGSSFSEDEIKEMLASLHFTASAKGEHQEAKVVVPKSQSVSKTKLIKCLLTRNADSKGLFNPADQSLTVLKGSRINPIHVNKISETSRKKRDIQLAEYSEVRDGKLFVKEDVHFETPSGAAQFCVGGSANGWKEWKDEKGRELNEYRIKGDTYKSGGRFDEKRVKATPNFYLELWTKFKTKMEATGVIPRLQTPQPRNWYDMSMGHSNILLNNVCNTQKNFVGVRLYIRNKAVDKYYPVLEGIRSEINKALGCEPRWDANPSAKDKTIAINQHFDLTDPMKVDEAIDWMVKQTVIFYEVFSKEVKGMK